MLGSDAVGYFTGVLITSTCLAVSFYMLPLKKLDSLFQLWYLMNKVFIIGCFLGLLLGLNKLYDMNHNLVAALYPIYDLFDSAASCFNSTTDDINENFVSRYGEISQSYAYSVQLYVKAAFVWIPRTLCGLATVLWVIWVFVFPRSKNLQQLADFSIVEYVSSYFSPAKVDAEPSGSAE